MMAVSDWLADIRAEAQRDGAASAARLAALDAWPGVLRRVGQYANYGDTVWQRDWDVLVVLDACRHDVMQEVAPRYDWLPDDVPAVYSAASMSEEWLEKHTQSHHQQALSRTALAAANPHTRFDCLRRDAWASVEEVWRHAWDDDLGTIPPRAVTDAAIRLAREDASEQLIAWYMQPHQPFLDAQWSRGYDRETFGEGGHHGECVWRQCRDGSVDRDDLWRAYRRTLEWALDDVQLLCENIDGTVAITADHANALGECGVWGHPKHAPVPACKCVPWIEMEATDTETHTPSRTDRGAEPAPSVEERLTELGYV